MKGELRYLLRSAWGGHGLGPLSRIALKFRNPGLGSTQLHRHRIEYTSGDAFIEMFSEIFERECYYCQFDRDDPEILDIGANIGLASIYLKQLYPRARITAIEPNPEVFEVMRTNLRSFGFHDIRALRKAVACRTGQTVFACDSGLGSRIVANEVFVTSDPTVVVDVVGINSLVDRHFDLVKMDIEGIETELFLHDSTWLGRCDRVFFEHHQAKNASDSLPEILAALKSNGFEYLIAPATRKLRGFSGVPAYQPFSRQQNVWAWKPSVNHWMRSE